MKAKDTDKSGVKSDCIFNFLWWFHVLKNVAVDLMHDLLEGVLNYVMARILLALFTLHY